MMLLSLCLSKKITNNFVAEIEMLQQTQSLLMDKVIKNKRGLELATSCTSGYETSSEKFFY